MTTTNLDTIASEARARLAAAEDEAALEAGRTATLGRSGSVASVLRSLGGLAPEERRAVRHLGIDLVEPGERYSAGRFAREAAVWLSGVPAGTGPGVVGGTGFYVRALVDGLFQEPPMDPGRRERLRAIPGQVPPANAWPAGCRFHPRCPHAWGKCRDEMPPLLDAEPGHRARCWLVAEPTRRKA